MNVYLVFGSGTAIKRQQHDLLGAFTSQDAAVKFVWSKDYVDDRNKRCLIASRKRNSSRYTIIDQWAESGSEGKVLGKLFIHESELHGSALEALAVAAE